MNTQTYSLLRSRTFWTLVVMSLLPIANALVPILPVSIQAAVELVLGVLASAFHNSTAQNSGAVN
jgi:hypothetical protein